MDWEGAASRRGTTMAESAAFLLMMGSAVMGVGFAAWERHRRRADRLAADQERDDLLAIAAHELRAPLAAMQLTIDVILAKAQRELGDPWIIERLEQANQQSELLATLLDDLLGCTQKLPGDGPENMAAVDLASLWQETIRRYEALCRQSGSRVTLRVGTPAKGQWPRRPLERVATNLLTNALKYGRGRPIDVLIDRSGPYASFSVRDRGIGIAAADQQRIFQRRIRATAALRHPGYGLGLWITQRHVQQMGGRILVASKPEQGTTVVIQLPCEPPSPHPTAR